MYFLFPSSYYGVISSVKKESKQVINIPNLLSEVFNKLQVVQN